MKVSVKIPDSGKLLIETGQSVDFSTPLFKSKKTNLIAIPLANILDFSPENISDHLKKTVGESVVVDELLAENKKFLSSKKYFSQIDGLIKDVNHETGEVVIEKQYEKEFETKCFFKGEVVSINDGFIEIKVQKGEEIEIEKSLDYMGGEVFYHETGLQIREDDVYEKFIFTNSLDKIDYPKAEVLGAKGVIRNNSTGQSNQLIEIIINPEKKFKVLKENNYPYFIVSPKGNTLFFYK